MCAMVEVFVVEVAELGTVSAVEGGPLGKGGVSCCDELPCGCWLLVE